MRDLPYIDQLWDAGGPFVGPNKPNAWVTVEHDWYLTTEANPGRISRNRRPVRWWQRADNSQNETEIPGVKSINISRSLSSDAAEATITIHNVLPRNNNQSVNGKIDEWGVRGGLNPAFGQNASQAARWGHQKNEWFRVLLPGALVRTYQGYGGWHPDGSSFTRQEAIDAGHVVLTGVWRIDSVAPSTSGVITLSCRDMAGILIDQIMYPPLVPKGSYPTRFWRYVYKTRTISNPATPATTAKKRLKYRDSSSDRWYGANASIHGHRPGHALDGDSRSFWLSVGNSHPSRPFCLTGETRVLTKDQGRVAIKDLAGSQATVLTQTETGQAKWVEAPFRSFGQQEVASIEIKRFGRTDTIRATDHHRWFVRRGGRLEKVTTVELRPGDRLHSVYPQSRRHAEPSKIGVMAGLVFGDGSVSRAGSQIQLYGASRMFASLFNAVATVSERRTTAAPEEAAIRRTAQDYDHVQGLPKSFKANPDFNESSAYLLGWLAGYFAADGSTSANGNVVLCSSERWRLEAAERVADQLGIATMGIRSMKSDDRLNPRMQLQFVQRTVPDEFFLLPHHKQHMMDLRTKKSRKRAVDAWCWTVQGIEHHGEVEEVFCATVPETHSFVLDGYILTGNCADWWEGNSGEQVNSIHLTPWKGGYTCYVSIWENGRWQGSKTVPYDHTPLVGNQPHVVDTQAGIPYVKSFQVPWEQAIRMQLPRTYKADRIRLSFRGHTKSQWGPWFYRVGIREVRAEVHQGSSAPTWVDMAAHPSGYGYWAVSSTGVVQWFGDAKDFGRPSAAQVASTKSEIVSIEPNADGTGYMILASSGRVWSFGATSWAATLNRPAKDAVALCRNGGGPGHWIVCRDGSIHAFGGAPSYANTSGNVTAAATFRDGTGLYILHRNGVVSVRGAAVHRGNGSKPGTYVGIAPAWHGGNYYLTTEDGWDGLSGHGSLSGLVMGRPYEPKRPSDPIVAIVASPTINGTPDGIGTLTKEGYIFARRSFQNLGDPAGGIAQYRVDGNYKDLSEIVQLVLLWSGFWLKDGNTKAQQPAVFGNIESVGFAPSEPINEDFFDKKRVMDVITQIKEIVGYIFFVDAEGAVRFTSPNWWKSGNFLNSGQHVNRVREIDESHNLMSHTPTQTLKNERSEIIVSDGEPLSDVPGVKSARWVQPKTWRDVRLDYLRGLSVPASVAVPFSLTINDMRQMAELIAVQIRFKRKAASLTAVAHPGFELDDQVRIWDRATSEDFIHYVHSIETTQDLDTGSYTMNLSTYWLGISGGRDWAITTNEKGQPGFRIVDNDESFVLSERLQEANRLRMESTDTDRATVPLVDQDAPIPPDGGGGNLP